MSSERRAGGGGTDAVARLDHVTKVYETRVGGARWRSVFPMLPEQPTDPLIALDEAVLDVRPGEALGLIGPNGAGKSTALKLLGGITEPTSGTVTVNGSVRSMIELGAGFHDELTGEENAWCSLTMYDTPRREVREATAEIAAFAGLGDAMAVPIKHYSLGMRARLAFAVATSSRPDLLLVDEALAVGDADFQLRCIERIGRMITAGTALVFVSHEMPLVSMICHRVAHMRQGRIVDVGPAEEVVERYLSTAPSRHLAHRGTGPRIARLGEIDDVDPWDPVLLDLTLEVDRRLDEPRIAVELSLPTIFPDLVFTSSVDALPGAAGPGTITVSGRIAPLGVENSLVRATVSLLDGIAVHDVAREDFHIRGPTGSSRPELAVIPRFRIERVGDRVVEPAPHRPRRAAPADPIVSVDNATKTFRSDRHRLALRGVVPGRLGRTRGNLVAVDDVSFQIGRGESVGLIGPNGSGKSTLLRTIAGITGLDSGSIHVDGSALAVLDLGPGLHPTLTGRENIERLGLMMGLDRRSVRDRVDWILAFAELGDAIDAPAGHYSSGMRARLALAVALSVPRDLLLVDEVLSVGDEEFRRTVLDEIAERVRNGMTLLLVSHELRLIEQACGRVLRLDRGMLVDDGAASQVVDAYGTTAWSSGVRDATSGVRFLPLNVRRRHIQAGDDMEVSGSLIVDVPSPHARLECSYRGIQNGVRPEIVTADDRARVSLLRHTMEPSGGILTRPGTYEFDITIERNVFVGAFDVVISVIDERDETICAETYQEVMVGAVRPEGFPGPVLSIDWAVRHAEPHHSG